MHLALELLLLWRGTAIQQQRGRAQQSANGCAGASIIGYRAADGTKRCAAGRRIQNIPAMLLRHGNALGVHRVN
jgi:hypothetical protein